MLSKSRVIRRWHAIGPWFLALFEVLGGVFKRLNAESVCVIDSFPMAACDTIRIPRARLYQDYDIEISFIN